MRVVVQGHAVDVVGELPGQRVLGIEVKASSAPNAHDARLPEKFIAGIVPHTGPSAFSLGAQLLALPIASLWT